MPVFNEYAQFYDLYYADKDYEAEARFVLDLAARFGGPTQTILDMGCGTGRHMVEFLKRGIQCEGFDQSYEMLEQARKRLARSDVPLRKDDLTTFRSGRTYDVVVSLFAVMGYLVDNTDLIAGFQTAAVHLNNDGLFIFDGWFGPAVLDTHPEHRRHEYRRDGEVVVREATPAVDPLRQSVTVTYDLQVLRDGEPPRDSTETHTMRLMFLQEVSLAAAAAGLEIIRCCPFMEPEVRPTTQSWNVWFVARKLRHEALAAPGSDHIEWIKWCEQVLALIIPAGYKPGRTEFVSPESYKQQVGFIVYPRGGIVIPHIHHELARSLTGMSEILLVRSGRCYVDLYLDDKTLFCTRELNTGDVVSLVSGGHGFRMTEDTVFLEIKQGPYLGEHEKERF